MEKERPLVDNPVGPSCSVHRQADAVPELQTIPEAGKSSQQAAALGPFAADEWPNLYGEVGSCVTSVAGPNGDAQLYER